MAAWEGEAREQGGWEGGGMICPYCLNMNSPKEVIRTWTVKNGSVKRKRKCSRCKREFHTVEMIVVLGEKILHNLHAKQAARTAILIYVLWFVIGDMVRVQVY